MKKKPSRKKRLPLVFAILALVLLVGAFILLRLAGAGAGVSTDPSSQSSLTQLADSTKMVQYAKSVKADMSDVLKALKKSDVEGMLQSTDQLDKDIAALKEELNSPIWSLAEHTPKVGKEITTAKELVTIAENTSNQLLKPLVSTMQEYPLDSFKAKDGINVKSCLAYMDFLEGHIEDIKNLSEQLGGLDLSVIDPKGSMNGYVKKLNSYSDIYDNCKDYFPVVRTILGNGEDRVYVFAAQNSAEIRASGGFPGSVGVMRIKDGILKIDNFKSVYSMFHKSASIQAKITQQESQLFTARMYTPWDSDFCPDFERVGLIWALAYEDKAREECDGVISATPAVIQKLLALCDPVTLSDGTEITSENAARVLQHDMYFQYVNGSQMNIPEGSRELDDLFAEAADKTLSQLIAQFSTKNIKEYLNVFGECLDEHILVMWMKDEAEEDLIRKSGWGGCLNSDPNDPKLGIYFSLETAGKMGWFLDMVPEIGEPTVNDDGSRSYDVTLTLSNVISEEELKTGGTYILGRSYTGSVAGDLTLCAPAGGSISNVEANWERRFQETTYHDLNTHFLHWLVVERGKPITVTFRVTTAPGVETPLGVLSTPTLTAYR